MPKRITTAEAAKLLGVTRQQIANLVESGDLPAIREPFGPGTRFMLYTAAVAKRVAAKARGEIKTGPKPVAEPPVKGKPARKPGRTAAKRRK